MFYQEYKPPIELEPYVHSFWALEHNYDRAPMKEGERIWPDGHFELLFTYGKKYQALRSKGWTELPRSFLIGLFTKELYLRSDGMTGIHGVRFHGYGIYPYLNQPLHEMTNSIVSASTLFGPNVEEIENEASRGRCEGPLPGLISFLLNNLPKAGVDRLVFKVGREIYKRNGIVRMSELSEALGVSARRIQRNFYRETGLSAKHFARIVRFKYAKSMIEKNPKVNLAEVAFTCGYADQPHFIKNFKSFFGITPQQHRDRMYQLKSYNG